MSHSHRPIAQSDIAVRLGIGQKTVSRVFGGGPVSDATRQRVMAAARELGYRPNAGARAMRTGRTGSIVLLQSTRESASNLPNQVLAGIGEALADADANLVVVRFDDARLLGPGNLPKALRELTGDGVLMNYDTDVPAGLHDILSETGLPVVWINVDRPHDAVRPDDHSAGAALARHFLAHGHRRLAWSDLHLRWTGMHHYSRDHRRDGFLAAAREAGAMVVDWSPETVVPDVAGWYAERLAQPSAPTAVAGYGELEFFGLLRAACLIGRRVPEQLSLAGIQSGPLIGAPVDSVDVDLHALGHQAACMLLDRIAGAAPLPSRLIPPTIRPGGTVATAPA